MKLVILDLDETLIHSCDEWIGRRNDFMAANKMIFERPFAKNLVQGLMREYKVAVWTAAYGKYAADVIDYIFGCSGNLEFIWDRSKCIVNSNPDGVDFFVKDLIEVQEASWNRHDFCIVDDRPEQIVGDATRVVGVKPYFGSSDDRELKEVATKIRQCITNAF